MAAPVATYRTGAGRKSVDNLLSRDMALVVHGRYHEDVGFGGQVLDGRSATADPGEVAVPVGPAEPAAVRALAVPAVTVVTPPC